MEEYCRDGNDINEIRKDANVGGYDLGQMICIWKSQGTSKWMTRPELKTRLDAMGFDPSMNKHQVKFAKQCRRLKAWKMVHNGANPGSGGKNDNRDDEEKAMYMFRWNATSGKHKACAEHMKHPKLRALFEEADAAGGGGARRQLNMLDLVRRGQKQQQRHDDPPVDNLKEPPEERMRQSRQLQQQRGSGKGPSVVPSGSSSSDEERHKQEKQSGGGAAAQLTMESDEAFARRLQEQFDKERQQQRNRSRRT